MARRLIAAAMMAAIPPSGALAAPAPTTAEDVIKRCNSSDPSVALSCELMVEGIAGTAAGSDGLVTCPPAFGGAPATLAELAEPERSRFRRVRVVQPLIRWLVAHPQPAQVSWVSAIEIAALDLWPCQAPG